MNISIIPPPSTVRIDATNTIAPLLQANYAACVSQNTVPATIYNQMFELNESESIVGFSISLDDFIDVFSYPGITHWYVSFGYNPALPDPAHLPLVSAGFVFIIQGYGDTPDRLETPAYLFTQSISKRLSAKEDANYVCYVVNEEDPYGEAHKKLTSVHYKAANKWRTAWDNLMTAKAVPPHVLHINRRTTGSTVLTGYVFRTPDFALLLDPTNTTEEVSQICFELVNLTKPVGAQAEHPGGTLGFMIASATNTAIATAFLNFSSPCPPTCPTDASS